MTSLSSSALVLFSGGQDSATCLAYALSRFERVETVGFAYGQRHKVELEARQRVRDYMMTRPEWVGRLGPDHMLSMPAFGEIGDTAMTADLPIVLAANGLPTTFVPGRNIAFFTFAGALASRRGLSTIIGGMCEADAAGYPDCRADTIEAMEKVLRLGVDPGLSIRAPLVRRTKAETWDLAQHLGGDALVEMILEESHTCYKGDRSVRHAWGYGCGECPACVERRKGYEGWQAAR
ncbi:7-cyano-7-deazaguanine synthase QueC [Parvularcula sp. LCG005]|uniref:7-cyano-7-deazaguanine synthase QueC n=1 Tax=Parvularcula sp. LCG005 TaxID=3078805 RepID=UPI00294358C5|nr:7-cyano-7-deazaguanine synthase QueC [Parvularcula sp. LCG005]WOI53744.1 7-cyano-7-deazaguanine synthase QueC [Parvularcula sp. LCG005]